jgi:hypothetical protein
VPPTLLLALLLAAPPVSPAPLADAAPPRDAAAVSALVRRCVDAYGGPEAVKRAARFRQEGLVSSLLHPGDQARLVRIYDRVRGLRVEVGWANGAESRVLASGHAWREGVEVTGPRLAAMVLQAARLDLPALLSALQARVTDGGPVELQGKRLRALKLDLGPGLHLEADLDPATGRILRSRGSADGEPPIGFETTYDDFRTVDGVLVAFHEGNWANGAATGDTMLTSSALLPAGGDEAFRP